MSAVVIVHVPCEVVRVHVRVGFGDTVSPIEDLVLRAVHGGLNEVGALEQRLGLGRRIIDDLIYDLWRHGHLTVDHRAATVAVSDQVAACVEADDLSRLGGAEAVQQACDLMIDKLTLRVLPARGRQRPPHPRLCVPADDRRVGLEDLPQHSVLHALNEALRRTEPEEPSDRTRTRIQGRSRMVQSYRIPPPGLRESMGRRWIEMKVHPHWDEERQSLTVTVVDDLVPAELREAASDRLTELCAQSPRSAVYAELRQGAQGALLEPPSAETALARLAGRVERAPDIPAGRRHAWHEEMADDARQLDGLLRDRVEREMRVTTVWAEEHRTVVDRLIADAQTQLVIVSPWIRYRALTGHLDALGAAVRRGVRIVLVWGADADSAYDDALDEQTRNALEDLARQAPAGALESVVIPRTTSRTHAKLVVSDHHTALVTSRNVLSGAGDRPEAGVLLEAGGTGGSIVVSELLGWVRSVIPSYPQSREVRVRASKEAAQETAAPHPSAPAHDGPARRPQVPAATPAEAQAPPALAIQPPAEHRDAEASVRVWTRGWLEHVERTRDFLEDRALPSLRLVTDEAHRSLLRHALDKAAHRLVIASDGLSAEVVDQGMLGSLRACLERGVHITLSHAAPDRGTGTRRERYEEARTALVALRGEHPEGMEILEGTNHAKVLLWDDNAVVGSFNYLSFEGRYGRHRLSSELSVRLTGRAIADTLATALGAPATRPALRAAQPRHTSVVASGSAYAGAQDLLSAYIPGVPPTPALLREALTASGDPWAVLNALGEEAPAELVRPVAARCLADHGAAGSRAADAERWLRWLIADCWREARYVEAAVLRQALPAPQHRPRVPLTLLAAARDTPLLAETLTELALDNPDEDERNTALAAAVTATLLRGDPEALDVVLLLTGELRDVWAELAERTTAYWQRAYQPIPLAQVRRSLGGSERERTLDEAWQTLQRLLHHAKALTFENTTSTRTHRHLFDNVDGEFAQLIRVAEERTAGGLQAWRETAGAVHDPVRLVESTGTLVSPQHPPMHGAHLKRYLNRLEPVIAQTRSLVALYADEDGTQAALPPGAESFGRWLASRWEALGEATAQMTGPERRLTRTFLDDIEELARWGSR
ncbi:hypothetical protein ACFZAU_24820 [Streptomyces sp. NPDC008238]